MKLCATSAAANPCTCFSHGVSGTDVPRWMSRVDLNADIVPRHAHHTQSVHTVSFKRIDCGWSGHMRVVVVNARPPVQQGHEAIATGPCAAPNELTWRCRNPQVREKRCHTAQDRCQIRLQYTSSHGTGRIQACHPSTNNGVCVVGDNELLVVRP